jgi:hypothetical protein
MGAGKGKRGVQMAAVYDQQLFFKLPFCGIVVHAVCHILWITLVGLLEMLKGSA